MIGGIILIFVLVALVAGAVVGVRRLTGRGRTAPTPEGHAVRQFFQYLLLFGLLVVTAVGVAGLLATAFAQTTTIVVTDSAIARSVAFTVVGLPLLTGVALWSRRTLADDPAESRSVAWLLYLSAASLISLLVALFALHDVLSWLLDLRPFSPQALANALVWTAVWGFHWWRGARRADQPLLQPQLLAGSLLGLVLGLVGLGVLLTGALDTWFGLDETELIVGRHQPILEGAVTLLLAAAVWALYWLVTALRTPRNVLWHGYVLLAGAAAGLIVAVTAASVGLYRLLVWLVGQPGQDDADRYFSTMPETVAATVVGLLTLAYHQTVLGEEQRPGRTEIDRVRDYLLAVIGLGAATAGTTIVIVALVEAVADPSLVSSSGPANTLIAALTLLGVGAPVWWFFWSRGQRAAAASHDEVVAPTRRLYLFVLLGVASLAAVGALLAGAWLLVDHLLQGDPGLVTLRSIRFPIGILVTSAAVAAYHWSVYRGERQPAAPRPTGPQFVVLLGVADAATAASIHRRTGALTWAWTRWDSPPETWSEDELVAAAESSGAPEVLVLADDGRLRSVPISRRPPTRAQAPSVDASR